MTRTPSLIEWGHGFFAIDVLSGLDGVDQHRRVMMVGSRDQDGVNVIARQDFHVVDIALGIGASDLEPLLQVGLVDIARREHFRAAEFDKRFSYAAAPSAGADESEGDALIGSFSGAGKDEGRRGCTGQKLTTAGRIVFHDGPQVRRVGIAGIVTRGCGTAEIAFESAWGSSVARVSSRTETDNLSPRLERRADLPNCRGARISALTPE